MLMHLEPHRTASLVYKNEFHDNAVWTQVPRMTFSDKTPQGWFSQSVEPHAVGSNPRSPSIFSVISHGSDVDRKSLIP